uniref:Uncharacterized protein n=1 Tax=Parascaris equorum TaxID=6256 RepID=A0A914S5R1_PAREQ
MFTMNNWPVEFDHLKLPQGEKSRSVAFSLDPFAGIELDVGQSVDAQPQAKEILIDSVLVAEDTNKAEKEDGFQ